MEEQVAPSPRLSLPLGRMKKGGAGGVNPKHFTNGDHRALVGSCSLVSIGRPHTEMRQTMSHTRGPFAIWRTGTELEIEIDLLCT